MALPESDSDLLELAQPGGPPAGARGLFHDQGWLRRVSGAPVALFGGGRALLLEVAHPFVAAAVAEHLAYRTDPFGRLQRTLAAMQAISFGDVPAALAASRAIERAHGHVKGTLPDAAGPFPAGTPYSGRDPEAARWVWATLADTAWLIYERFVEPLDAAAREAYYADHRVLARLVGVPPELVPGDWAAFRAYFDGMIEGDLLDVTPLARDIADSVLHPPIGLGAARLARSITAGLLPPKLREAFGLPWDEVRERRLADWVAEIKALRAGRSRPAACGPADDQSPSAADPNRDLSAGPIGSQPRPVSEER